MRLVLCIAVMGLTLSIGGCGVSSDEFKLTIKEHKQTDNEISLELQLRFDGKKTVTIHEGEGRFGGDQESPCKIVIRAARIDTPAESFPDGQGTRTVKMTYSVGEGPPGFTKVYPPSVVPDLQNCLAVDVAEGKYALDTYVDIGTTGWNPEVPKGKKKIMISVGENLMEQYAE